MKTNSCLQSPKYNKDLVFAPYISVLNYFFSFSSTFKLNEPELHTELIRSVIQRRLCRLNTILFDFRCCSAEQEALLPAHHSMLLRKHVPAQ